MTDPQVPAMDSNSLWREEVFTDRKVGTIRRLTPIKADGSTDLSRKAVYQGEAALMTPAGQLPLTFDIPADDLAGAVAGYGAGLEKGYREALEELQRLRREASSQIVIPKGGLPPPPPGGLGKLKL
ncbi:MAG: hypothetical protein HY925_13125 [Elusimicrobia bacterium]|nr:hypothetical protein [Elusimicrobiota bacterium]